MSLSESVQLKSKMSVLYLVLWDQKLVAKVDQDMLFCTLDKNSPIPDGRIVFNARSKYDMSTTDVGWPAAICEIKARAHSMHSACRSVGTNPWVTFATLRRYSSLLLESIGISTM